MLFKYRTKTLADKKAFRLIKEQVAKKPNSLIGFAVGKTTDGLHRLISKDAKEHPKRWKNIRIIQIDENLGISTKSPVSFNYELRKELKPLFKLLPSENIFLIDGKKNAKKTITKANKFIRENKGIDLITLGIGPEYDPHIAYNTSGKSTLNSRLRVVDLHPLISKKVKVKQGITLGIKDILNTKIAILIAYGSHKKKSLSMALNEKINLKTCPASALQKHKGLFIVTDLKASP